MVREMARRTLWQSAALALAALALTSAAAQADFAEPQKVAQVLAGERTEAVVSWWGFDAEDSTAFMQAAIDSGAARVVVPYMDGQDWIVRPITMTQDDQTLFFEDKVVVRSKEGSIRGRGTRLFQAIGRNNVSFVGYGATLRMGFDDVFVEEYRTRRRRGGDLICVLGSENVLIEGLTLIEARNDGIYVGRDRGGRDYSKNVTVRNVVSDRNIRQGMSIVSVDGMLVENSVFKNTRGGAPMAGIDCETHRPEERLSNVVIRNCLFLNNSQLGLHNFPSKQTADSAPVSILWENNYVRGSVVGIQVASVQPETPPGEIVFRNNIIEGSSFAGILIRNVSAESALQIRFSGNILINTAHEQYDEEEVAWYRKHYPGVLDNPGDWYARHGCPSAPIVLTAARHNFQRQGNISFDNDLVISNLDKPAVVVSGAWGEHREMFGPDGEPAEGVFQAWKNVTGSIRVVNPHGARMDVRTPVEEFTLEIK